MSDIEYCAREGCGAPRAWHSYQSPIVDLFRDFPQPWRATGQTIEFDRPEGSCICTTCDCAGFLKPKPDSEPYVVEMVPSEREVLIPSGTLIPLAEYLASHPQPDGPMCVCRHKEDAHDGSGCLYRFCTCVGYNEVQP